MNTRETLKVNEKGHLEIGGADCVELAAKFSTPLYVFDEAHIRAMMRCFRRAMGEYRGDGLVLYASKAFCCEAMYAIARQEGLGADVVSDGELYTALRAGFPSERLYMHGNNKLPAEIERALDARIGCFVVDSHEEALRLEEEAGKRGFVQKVLIRINPGVEAHTHQFIQTATPDSKFGFCVSNGEARAITEEILSLPHLDLAGYHCHIGSQIFERASFLLAVKKCLAFVAEMRDALHFTCRELDLGGGFGIWYADGDRALSPEGYYDELRCIVKEVEAVCDASGLPLPFLLVEPGRSIVGEAGITLYTAGSVKKTAHRTYLTVDGGMFDNPRYCLYEAKYTAVLANRAAETPTQTYALAGKCCESGDVLGLDFKLPQANAGDLVAVLSTGAYNYSMASNYNRNRIPPAILVHEGHAEYIVLPQTLDDIVRFDTLPQRLR